MYTLQNDMLTQIMVKHIRQREYIPIYFALVSVALLFLWEACVEEWARVFALDRAALWPPWFYVVGLQASGAWFSWF